jgi:TRAP-type uncharacterized transport system substrate-binding protein
MKKFFSFALAAIAMSTTALAADTEVKICTGNASGVYYEVGMTIASYAKGLTVNVIETEGTDDNIMSVAEGSTNPTSCNAMIGQPDGLVTAIAKKPYIKKSFRKVGVLHREYLHVLCNKDKGIEDLADLEGTKETLDVGAPGSGSWITWQNLVAEDDGYQTVQISTDGGELALAAVSSGEAACMLVASGLGSGIMQIADSTYYETVTLVGANDKDFNDAQDMDGKPLYTYAEIDSVYKNLQSSWGSDVETISWNASVYVDPTRFDKKVLNSFINAVGKAAVEVRSKRGK